MSRETEQEGSARNPAEQVVAAGESREETADEAAIDDLGVQLEAITMERDRLATENEELKERLLRRQAEFENYRRRVEKEKFEFSEYAAMEAVRALLPVLDDFERALKAAPAGLGEGNEYVKGVEMIAQRLMEALKNLGLEPIESVGKPFDPNLHHAVERVPTDKVEDHTVLEEWQKGYNFKGKLLREAMVRVAVKPPSEE